VLENILNWFGFKYIYIDERGIFAHRYDGTDATCSRPIHKDLAVAYPTAYKAIVKKSFEVPSFNSSETIRSDKDSLLPSNNKAVNEVVSSDILPPKLMSEDELIQRLKSGEKLYCLLTIYSNWYDRHTSDFCHGGTVVDYLEGENSPFNFPVYKTDNNSYYRTAVAVDADRKRL
jgi:hypothetical protein